MAITLLVVIQLKYANDRGLYTAAERLKQFEKRFAGRVSSDRLL